MDLKKLRRKLVKDYPHKSEFRYYDLKEERTFVNQEAFPTYYSKKEKTNKKEIKDARLFHAMYNDSYRRKTACLTRLIFIDLLILKQNS